MDTAGTFQPETAAAARERYEELGPTAQVVVREIARTMGMGTDEYEERVTAGVVEAAREALFAESLRVTVGSREAYEAWLADRDSDVTIEEFGSEHVDRVAWHAAPFAETVVATTFQDERRAAVGTLRRQAFARIYRDVVAGDRSDDGAATPDGEGDDCGESTAGNGNGSESGSGSENAGERGKAHPDPAHEWPLVESVTEYETGWFDAGYDRVEQPDGSEKNYYWAELPPAVVVVARTDDAVVMVDQYRPVIREQCLELPAGIVEDDESYSAAAARELREETGFDPAGVSLLAEYWCATGVLRHRRAVVFAEGLEPVERDLDANEFLSVRTVPVTDALDAARRQPANDATIEGILIAREEGLL